MIIGADHAHWDWTQDDPITGGKFYVPINFAASQAQFVFLKACDGARDTPFYSEAIRDARAAGKLAAPYVWCHGKPWYDPRKQGEFWYSRLKDEPLIAVDFESYSTSVPNYDDLYNAVYRMRELGYVGKIMLYTNWGYWLSYGSPASVWLSLFDGGLWLSDPDDDPPNCPSWAETAEKLRKAPTPFLDYVIHQNGFSGDPAKYGVTNGKAAVDENIYAGKLSELITLFGGTSMTHYGNTINCFIRNAPGGAIVGALSWGDAVEASAVNRRWWTLTKARGQPVSGQYIYEGNAMEDRVRYQRLFLLHDFQSSEAGYLPRVWGKNYGLPETEKFRDSYFEKMNEAYQRFWFDLLRYYAPDTMAEATLKQRWANLTDDGKAFTNKHGSRTRADYINGTNLDKEPMSQETLTTCGNPLVRWGEPLNKGGVMCYPVLLLDRDAMPDIDTLLAHPYADCFIHAATVCRPEAGTEENFPVNASAPNGTFRVDNFPQLDGKKVPVPVATRYGERVNFKGLACRVNWIRSDRLVMLDFGEMPSPVVR